MGEFRVSCSFGLRVMNLMYTEQFCCVDIIAKNVLCTSISKISLNLSVLSP